MERHKMLRSFRHRQIRKQKVLHMMRCSFRHKQMVHSSLAHNRCHKQIHMQPELHMMARSSQCFGGTYPALA